RWQAAACYRRISAVWNNSAEWQENCLITWLGGPLTSRLVFALGLGGSVWFGVRMPDSGWLRAGCSLWRRGGVGLLRCKLRFLAALCRRLLFGFRRNRCDQSSAGLGRAGIDRGRL